MAVAETIGPHRRRELHARLLAVLQDAGTADPVVLARHAEGARDVAAIRLYALDAARRSAVLGAHRQAAAQYQRALRYADTADRHGLAGLQEGLAAEYALLDRPEDSEAALGTALKHRNDLRDNTGVGEDLTMLSGILRQQCRGEESGRAAEESLRLLRSLPPGPELAMAHAGVARSMWDMGRHAEAFDGIARALELGNRLRRDDVMSLALTLTGTFLADSGEDGTSSIKQALRLALAAQLERQAPTPRHCCCSGAGTRPPTSAPGCSPSRTSHRRIGFTRCGSSAPSAAAAVSPETVNSWTGRQP
jgi:tetratricopeptide (TPR) repeat protein